MDKSTKTPQASEQDIANVMRGRAKTYAFLSRLYRTEVDQEFLDTMHGMRFPAASGNHEVDEGNRLIAHYMSNIWANTLTELAIDYVRVFIGHGNDGYSAAYPFESVYTSEKRLLMQEARDEVVACYRAHGLAKSPDWPECEDHVGLELEFMMTLAERAANALEAGDEDDAIESLQVQQAFLREHLCAWTPMLTADMRTLAQTDLYRGLAALTDGYLASDLELLNALLAGVDAAAQE